MINRNHFLPRKAPALFGLGNCEVKTDSSGTKVMARYMGSGRFTTVYRVGSDVLLYTFYNDFSKSILAHAYREHGKDNPHLPQISRIGQLRYEGREVNVYQAKYYNKVIRKRLSPTNAKIVNILQDAHDDACHLYPNNIVRNYKGHDFNQVILDAKGLPTSMRRALEYLAQVSLDWGDHYIFDNFHIRNMGLDTRSRLVLIDPMFDMDKVQKDHDFRRRSGRTMA